MRRYTRDISRRFSEYRVYLTGTGITNDISQRPLAEYAIPDPTVPRFRPKAIIAETGAAGATVSNAHAQWECSGAVELMQMPLPAASSLVARVSFRPQVAFARLIEEDQRVRSWDRACPIYATGCVTASFSAAAGSHRENPMCTRLRIPHGLVRRILVRLDADYDLGSTTQPTPIVCSDGIDTH
ncbi:hypothetical protein [Paraburkholderia sp. BL25I1N1]|uniref:hypothetical protein n=1 Tax=Paraburkholderia sp. BL25I1N1 TaxID=1938804 RepID=UPI000D0601B3|nr:hypothetical protein [Paraburkholderia sp. BL25I1N1]PRY04401.1 hypothetical protein B0G73_11277 [Paraburkholderia sp. BL25I1N1]